MRFSELIAEQKKKHTQLVNIPQGEFVSLLNSWTHKMGKKAGYRRETRMEHWQEAIDTVYTTLEGELKTIDSNKIMGHEKWNAMILAAQLNFPEHIRIYHPTPVEQQKVTKLVKVSSLARILKDKMELMTILKEDKSFSVETISDLMVSRLQCEVLAASAANLVAAYKGSALDKYQLNMGAETDASTSGSASRTKSSAEASASASASAIASASYDSGVKKLRGGFEHRVRAAVEASASASAEGGAEAKTKSLAASANAGLDATSSLSADFDYEINNSCKVKVDVLRRTLGDKFKLIEAHIGGHAETSVGARASAEGSAALPNITTKHDYKGSPVKAGTTAGLRGSASAEVEIAVKVSGRAGLTIMQTADIELTGDLAASAAAAGNIEFFVNGRGVGIDIGASAMAGFSASSEQKFSLKHTSRNISIFSLKLSESFSAGAGVSANLSAMATVDSISFDTSAGATLGIGSSLGFSTVISPRGVALAGYDLFASSAVAIMEAKLKNYDPANASSHMRRMKAFTDFMNRKTSKAEVNQVYLDCQNRVLTMIASLNAEMDHMNDSGMKWRTAGFTGHSATNLTDIGVIASAYHEAEWSNRKTPLSVVFGSEADKGDDKNKLMGVGEGERGKTVTQTALQTDPNMVRTAAVDPAKQNLHSVVAAYETAKLQGNGERLAFDVIRKELLTNTINYS